MPVAKEPPMPNLPETLDLTKCLRADVNLSHQEEPLRRLLEVADRRNSWTFLVNMTNRIIEQAYKWLSRARLRLQGKASDEPTVGVRAEDLLIKQAQQVTFADLYKCLKSAKRVPNSHKLLGLSPFLDKDGLIRVGGRLQHAGEDYNLAHPILLPECTLISSLLMHLHKRVEHQGRYVTTGYIRSNGYHVEHSRRVIGKLIKDCVQCRRLRGSLAVQKMADLPPERVSATPPFQQVGLDVFGPLYFTDSKTTRSTKATKKMFVLLITCLASRAVHLEPLASLETNSFINAMRRFFSIRGECSLIRSDRGSNFIGALSQCPDFEKARSELSSRGCSWILNTVGASHFGGIYERKIGSIRRILEASIMSYPKSTLDRDELTTLLMETAAIVNATPLYEPSEDPNDPYPITPAMLLTQKYHAHSPPKETAFDKRDLLSYGPRRWRRIQFLANVFWDKWRNCYLQELTSRKKWKTSKSNLCAGDIVLLRSKNAPRNDWQMGVVKTPIVAADGLVRRVLVDVNAPGGKLRTTKKAVHDLVILYSPTISS